MLAGYQFYQTSKTLSIALSTTIDNVPQTVRFSNTPCHIYVHVKLRFQMYADVVCECDKKNGKACKHTAVLPYCPDANVN